MTSHSQPTSKVAIASVVIAGGLVVIHVLSYFILLIAVIWFPQAKGLDAFGFFLVFVLWSWYFWGGLATLGLSLIAHFYSHCSKDLAKLGPLIWLAIPISNVVFFVVWSVFSFFGQQIGYFVAVLSLIVCSVTIPVIAIRRARARMSTEWH